MTGGAGTQAGRLTLQLVALGAILWALVVWSVYNMDQPVVQLMMPMQAAWRADQVFFVWVMWAVMMAAMMLPSAYLMVVTYHRIASRKGAAHGTGFFVIAYLAVWSVFSIGATVLQWGLQSAGFLTHMLVISEDRAAAILMILIGSSQWTPIKQLCLNTCRTPIGFFTSEWRKGAGGAFRMGLRHGLFCVGCCWSLMALLFVFGVMNLTAIVLVTLTVMAEKTLPYGNHLARIGGAWLMLWGGLSLVGSIQ